MNIQFQPLFTRMHTVHQVLPIYDLKRAQWLNMVIRGIRTWVQVPVLSSIVLVVIVIIIIITFNSSLLL